MDLVKELTSECYGPITCIDMHTTGEPTRIIIAGYPQLEGTLLEQRAKAKTQHDNIRKCLLLEPRGHYDMYGAVLRPVTELTKTGDAHIGVLFMTNDGYSTMCGHATIALGRFLLDTHDKNVFLNRDKVKFDPATQNANLLLHAPCGLLKVTVPVTKDGQKSDPSRPVTFISVPSFATGVDVVVSIPEQYRWPELGSRVSVKADFSYGGAFFCIVPATELGFGNGLKDIDFDAMNKATKFLKAAVNRDATLQNLFTHPEYDDLSFLYSVMVVDKRANQHSESLSDHELGLCYFADQQVDRSPTGSGVAARMALAYATDKMKSGQSQTYHSLVTNLIGARGAFTGLLLDYVDNGKYVWPYPPVSVQISGYAYYTASHVFVVEERDSLGHSGFVFENLS